MKDLFGIALFVLIALVLLSCQTASGIANAPAPMPNPTPTPLPTEILDTKNVPMRLVPAGAFTMGSDTGHGDEKPVHTVELPAFYMDKYEVTNLFYKACMDSSICTLPGSSMFQPSDNYYDNPLHDNYPVAAVDWNQAKTYCEWRGARLPTEAEWEKAARGTDDRTYPWGEGIDATFANYELNGGGDTTEVGKYEKGKSPYGLYDMAGNVHEWVADWYDIYPGGDPKTLSDCRQCRVMRGGSFPNNPYSLRVSERHWNDPSHRNGNVGFRCAKDAAP
jgi:formylglycine-generating enzyme required for sulfatase activity